MDIPRPESNQPIPDNAQCVFKGVLFDVYQWEQTLFDGTVTPFEKIRRPDTVIVFPVLDDGRILLTEQQQPGKDSFIAGAGGRIEPGENPLEAAKREMKEETGHEAREFVLWDARQPVSKIDWAVYTFIARGARPVSDMNLDAGERITLKPVSFDEFLDIATRTNFAEKEIVSRLYEAKYDAKKRTELQSLLGAR